MNGILNDAESKLRRYFLYVTKWLDGQPEEQIAAGLSFDSPAAMYQRLQQDGFAVCEVCGETPVKPDHFKKHKRRRRATQTGEAIELPYVANASELFRIVLDQLAAAVNDLLVRKE